MPNLKDKNTFKTTGPVAWMAKNSVAANLLMVLFLVGGLLTSLQIKQEVFPEFTLDYVSISIPYPGASPEEIEKGIIRAVEEEVRGVDNVKRVTATATEGSASVVVELTTGADRNRGLQDIKSAVDRITSLPQDAERPVVSLISTRQPVISLILYGDLSERKLRKLADQTREELLQLPNVTLVELQGVRPKEIRIEIPQATLREYNITLSEVARIIARNAVEVPAGGVKTESGEILLRTDERRDYGMEFMDLPIINAPDGASVKLSQIARVSDTFRDIDREAYFNGKRAARIIVYRIGDQTPIEISETVNTFVDKLRQRLPEGIKIASWDDRSEIYRDRVYLLVKNAALGLLLVLIVLGLFLEPRLAFWVTMGIPISFLGAFLTMPISDVSINMISLFAFIISLGIVVDDAIVVGENIFEHRQKGLSLKDAAIAGVQGVKVPVTFAIMTNVLAFLPMFFLPGVMGKYFFVIPAIVVAVFIVSWIESLFILPAHLAHQKSDSKGRFEALLVKQRRFAEKLTYFIDNYYKPLATKVLEKRYLTLACGLAALIMTAGFFKGGWINFNFMPKVDADVVMVSAILPYGSPVNDSRNITKRLVSDAVETLKPFGGDKITRGIYSQIGALASRRGPGPDFSGAGGSHLCSVMVQLVSSDKRSVSASQIAKAWRKRASDIRGLESLIFKYSTGPSSGAAIDLELSHSNTETLETAAAELAKELEQYAGVKDIDDGFAEGKPQINFKLRPEARALGISAAELATQLRSAYYGARAFRQQRDRDEIWIMVSLPEEERHSEHFLEKLMIRTPQGGEIPLREAAELIRDNAYTEIKRSDGRRVVSVSADVNPEVTNAEKVLKSVQDTILPALLNKYPGLSFSLEGEQRDKREGMQSLGLGFIMAMIAIFAMLAIPFGSYIQPLVVMAAIPFGIIGAVFGHLLMGFDLSFVSALGMIALSGVVVNDSLVLVHYANELRAEGLGAFDAVLQAGVRRFRPIILTSLTTFFGLAPMIFETSLQARFLIPMALSLGFGVLFATVIALLLVPAFYLALEDLKGFVQRKLAF